MGDLMTQYLSTIRQLLHLKTIKKLSNLFDPGSRHQRGYFLPDLVRSG